MPDTSVRSSFSRAVGPIAILVGFGAIVLAFMLTNRDDSDPVAVTSNPAIEALIPVPGSEVLRQSQVGIDLAPGYDAEITINGTFIPIDEINVLRDIDDPDVSSDVPGTFDTTLSRFLYQPLEGRAVPELKGDENCVDVTFWPLSDPGDRQDVSWCFTVA